MPMKQTASFSSNEMAPSNNTVLKYRMPGQDLNDSFRSFSDEFIFEFRDQRLLLFTLIVLYLSSAIDRESRTFSALPDNDQIWQPGRELWAVLHD